MGSAETVKKMEKRNTGFQSRGMRDQGQIHGFLDRTRRKKRETSAPRGHPVAMISENGKTLRGQ